VYGPARDPAGLGDPPSASRRTLLTTVGGVAVVGLGGCLDAADGTADRHRYRLSARPLGPRLVGRFRWKPDGPDADPDDRLVGRIVATDSVTVAGVRLPERGAENVSYVEREGTYYELRHDEIGPVTRERWLLWFDRIDSAPPADAETFTSSLGLGDRTPLETTYGLSAFDVHAVESAAGRMAPEHVFVDLEDEPPGRRGYLFLRRSAEETDLVPDPPFSHVAFESGDGTVYARAVVERVPVELRQYRYTATPVAETTAAFDAYLREEYLTTTFDGSSLSEPRRAVLSGARSGRGYEETTPLSEAYTAVLESLGVADTAEPAPRRVEFSDEVLFAYDDDYYEAQLEIFG
jgi:hypothetical protein